VKIAIGLPTAVPGTLGARLLEWATRAERAGFSSLAVLDRVAYRNHDPIPVLAAAAAVTDRIGLLTGVLLGPVRGNGVLLAKQLATLDSLSGRRLTVGIAAGARVDDFAVTGSDFDDRGRRHDLLLAELMNTWHGAESVPSGVTPGGPPLLIGGRGRASTRRVTRFGHGWICGSGGPDQFVEGAAEVGNAWTEAGRGGRPRLAAVGYFALGRDADRLARGFIRDYYGFRDDGGEAVFQATPTRPAEVARLAARLAELGCDELVLYPCSADPAQVDRLGEAVGKNVGTRLE
jgi:alkanesulfonate monooxygenase SsuD/methylene tetrahydromethanopterin reductase-like flavin-dependent oxidoreductase (luciferase family)